MSTTVSLERVYEKVIFDMDGTLVDSRHPQGYLSAIDRMRARADACLVFEDADAGIPAAKAATAGSIYCSRIAP